MAAGQRGSGAAGSSGEGPGRTAAIPGKRRRPDRHPKPGLHQPGTATPLSGGPRCSAGLVAVGESHATTRATAKASAPDQVPVRRSDPAANSV